MANIEKSEYVEAIVDSLTFGIAKAENRMTGKSTVISRLAINELLELLMKWFYDTGITFKVTSDPVETLGNYLDVLLQSGLLTEDQISQETNENEVIITFKKCPYATACSDLIEEGISEFGCLRGASLLMAMMKSGKRVAAQYKNDPGNCRVTLQVKN